MTLLRRVGVCAAFSFALAGCSSRPDAGYRMAARQEAKACALLLSVATTKADSERTLRASLEVNAGKLSCAEWMSADTSEAQP